MTDRWEDMPPVRWEADGANRKYRGDSRMPWKCLGCGAELPEIDGKVIECPLPSCVDLRRDARRRMGLPEGGL